MSHPENPTKHPPKTKFSILPPVEESVSELLFRLRQQLEYAQQQLAKHRPESLAVPITPYIIFCEVMAGKEIDRRAFSLTLDIKLLRQEIDSLEQQLHPSNSMTVPPELSSHPTGAFALGPDTEYVQGDEPARPVEPTQTQMTDAKKPSDEFQY